MVSKRLDKQRQEAADAAEASAYPSPRYFQVHFQHLQQLIESLKEQVQETNRQLAELKQRQQDMLANPTPPAFIAEPSEP